METLDVFNTDHPFVDCYMKMQDQRHSQHISKKIVFWTSIVYGLWIQLLPESKSKVLLKLCMKPFTLV